ncbi:MAG: heat-shock protein [Alphaproteobacteria bacterium CG_4_10_14_0_8_um_filter_53_9]|nr:MAG: heat-shock protein [Alphaproteobacteria bacterium CG_4_10_14_0_8_um_filter_53_9]
MTKIFCGLDFGTSNSTVSVVEDHRPWLIPLEGNHLTIPSALFFSFEEDKTYFGRHAIADYVEGAEGRLMRALKSVLGTPLMEETTQVKNRSLSFLEILGTFIGHLKNKTEANIGAPLTQAVFGRPVHFVDGNPTADAKAQNQLETVARAQGFKTIDFQFEPISAALTYEQQVTEEKLALIVDIGGGTSDFSIVRVSPERAKAADRKNDILANAGVHLGGTDFDKQLSMAKVMPQLGYQTPNINGKQVLPASYYFDLATWQRINNLYKKNMAPELRRLHQSAKYPHLIERLIALVEDRQGHTLAGKVEDVKMGLTHTDTSHINLGFLKPPLDIDITKQEFEAAINEATHRIAATAQQTLTMASLTPQSIQAVFLTGGSTQIPLIKQTILSLFPSADIIQGDMFGSVGLGLALDAKRKFS